MAASAPFADVSTVDYECGMMPQAGLSPLANIVRWIGLTVAAAGCLFAVFFLFAFAYNWPGPYFSTLSEKIYYVAVVLPPAAALWLFLQKKMSWAWGFVAMQIIALTMASLNLF